MRRKGSLGVRIADGMELPYEMLGMPAITCNGRERITVEPCRRLLTYGEEEICLELSGMQLKILGKGLFLQYYRAGAIRIGGILEGLEFCPAPKEESR